MPVLMPRDTRDVLGPGAQKCESRSLLQQKLVFFDDLDDYKRVALDLVLTDGASDLADLIRRKERDAQKAKLGTKRQIDAEAFRRAVPPIVQNRRALSLAGGNPAWVSSIPTCRRRSFDLQTADRLIIGQADGVLENCGLTLHRFFGIPCIPGSALKGVTRDQAMAMPEMKKDLRAVFGNDSTDRDEPVLQGAVAFLPAFPVDQNARLEFDICTPHYKAYYGHEKDQGQEKNPKALDTENPVPNLFPVVAKGVVFRFHLLLLDKRVCDAGAERLLGLAENCLRLALMERGVGAKTAAGYGRFTTVQQTVPVVPGSAPAKVAAPGIPAEDPLIAKWRGKASSGNFVLIINDLAEIADGARLKTVFTAIMPAAQLGPNRFRKNNGFWQSFTSRPQGKAILDRLDLKLG